MKRYLGVALSRVQPWYKTDVAVEFRSGYMVITTSDGRWLGSWPAVRVTAEHLGASRVQLTLGDEKFAFDFEDPVGLFEALEVETHYLWKMTVWEKLVQVLRLSRVRFFTPREDQDPRRSGANGSSSSDPDQDDSHTPSIDRLMVAASGETDSAPEEPIHPELVAAQKDAVDAIGEGMRWWFGFYFLVGEGTDQERLHQAARGLQTASEHLWSIAKSLEDITGIDSSLDRLVSPYRVAVDGWAYAMDSIARGAVLDHKGTADEGFVQMANASAAAEHVVDHFSRSARYSIVSGPLSSLEELRPPTKVARKAVEHAKRPWQRAIVAAGSPFRRPH
jgi:hypothetical protein